MKLYTDHNVAKFYVWDDDGNNISDRLGVTSVTVSIDKHGETKAEITCSCEELDLEGVELSARNCLVEANSVEFVFDQGKKDDDEDEDDD